MSNVVAIPRRHYDGVRDADEAMSVVRSHMYGHDPELLAKRVGVSKSCIWAIRSGRTKWPRSGTFFALLIVLDLEMVIRPRGQ